MKGAIRELADLLARLPGIGKRTATRLVFHLLEAPEEYARELGRGILSLPDRVRPCSECGNLSDDDPCSICADPKRSDDRICVVASVPDLWAIESGSGFRGRFHVMHGLLSPLDGVGPDDLRLDELRRRVERHGTEEVVVATRPSVEGEATALLVRRFLDGLPVRTTRIASGISYGGELQYADRATLDRALEDRREIE